jgi:hypothetical protein
MILCEECRPKEVWFERITCTHLNAYHNGMTTFEYKSKYPYLPMTDEDLQNSINKLSSETQTGREVSDETREKLSETKQAFWDSEEGTLAKQKMSEDLTGRVNSEKHNRNISEARLGMVFSAETRERISLAKQEFWSSEEGDIARQEISSREISDETRQRMSISSNLFWNSDEGELAKEYLRDINTNREVSEETRRKLSKINLGRTHSEESKQLISEGNRLFWSSEEGILTKNSARQKISDSLKAFYLTEEGKASRANGLLKRAKTRKSVFPYMSIGEKYLASVLDFFFKDQYTYTGTGAFSIGTKTPDFRHTSKMKVIEYYGSEKFHIPGEEEERSREFAEHGYEVLFIRHYQISENSNREEEFYILLDRIKKFTYS